MADTAAAAPPESAARRTPTASPFPVAQLRSPAYLRLLLLAAVVGAPISAVAYWFLWFFGALQAWVFEGVPRALRFTATPLWWPLPVLALARVLVGLTLRYLPGNGGHWPVDGFTAPMLGKKGGLIGDRRGDQHQTT